ncbi:Asparagine--tRNA ligase (Asparaginyl-tRNA synthetase) (AsnRS), partial [Durusdinium trenchii]
LKVVGLADDARTTAVLATARLCAVAVQVELVQPAQLKKGVSPTNKLPVLYEGDQLAAFSTSAVMGYLVATAAAGKGDGLLGRSEWETSLVGSWMEYRLARLDPLCEVACLGPKDKLGDVTGAEVAGPAMDTLMEDLRALDQELATKSYLVGKSVSVADIVVCAALLKAFGVAISPEARESSLQNLTRWFEAVRTEVDMDAVLPTPFAMFSGKTAADGADVAVDMDALLAAAGAPPAEVQEVQASPSGVEVKSLFKRSRTRVKDILHAADGGKEYAGKAVVVCGWARTIREAQKGTLAFMELNDGSCYESIQVVASAKDCEGFAAFVASGGTSSSHRVVGTIIESPAKGQVIELKAKRIDVLGAIDQESYPLKKTGKSQKGHSVEFLREHAHLRARTHLIGCVARVRNACSHAIHEFFRQKGFMYVHTPLITASDCEGAGEMFSVSTLLGAAGGNKGQLPVVDAARKKALATQGVEAEVGEIDYKKDFFGKPAFLTVSGQLNVETYACALSDVYTFGPTFRAENSNTSRHLAEFWMCEPELCFATLQDDIDLGEEFIKFCTQYVMKTCASDIAFFDQRVEKGLIDRLKNVLETPFKRLTYTEAIDILNQPEHLLKDGKPRFEEHPEWGIDLGSEHERYLCEVVFQGPVVLIDYPADIKAFYMRQNELDDKGRLTVQAMDILVPRIGELVGGSAREERLDRLTQRIKDMKLPVEEFDWYCDLRRFGSVPHAGFGMGFERFVMFVTGVHNIRDVIPFPRYPGACAF